MTINEVSTPKATFTSFAEKTETWVDGVDGHKWEFYVKHSDVEQFVNLPLGREIEDGGNVCCPS